MVAVEVIVMVQEELVALEQSALFGQETLEHSHQLALDHLNFGVMNEFVY